VPLAVLGVGQRTAAAAQTAFKTIVYDDVCRRLLPPTPYALSFNGNNIEKTYSIVKNATALSLTLSLVSITLPLAPHTTL